MILTYEQLVSPYPIFVENVGHIFSPALATIYEVEPYRYNYYLNILGADIKNYFKMIDACEVYNILSEDEKSMLNIFDLWTMSGALELQQSLNFFFKERVLYEKELKAFSLYDDSDNCNKIGCIDRDNFSDICSLIMQLNYVEEKTENIKPKNKIAAKLLEKLNSNPSNKHKENNKNLGIANVISAVCTQHNSYNMTNIWSLTVYQLYDQFFRLNLKTQFDVSAMSVAAWGSDDFDFSTWYKSIK